MDLPALTEVSHPVTADRELCRLKAPLEQSVALDFHYALPNSGPRPCQSPPELCRLALKLLGSMRAFVYLLRATTQGAWCQVTGAGDEMSTPA